jgi:hypothetical protein
MEKDPSVAEVVSPGEQLTIECHRGNAPAALAIIAKGGADLNFKNSSGETALLYACRLGLADVVDALLATKLVDVNVVNKNGRTALISACERSQEPIALRLLEVPGINLNVIDVDSQTAFDYTRSIPAVRERILEIQLTGEPSIYLYLGHAGSRDGSLKGVPNGSKYVNAGTCGLINLEAPNHFISFFNKTYDKRFVEINASSIEKLLDGLSIRIYLPEPRTDRERYVDSIFEPICVFPTNDTFSLVSSGLVERKKSIFVGHTVEYTNLSSATLEMVKSLFSMSVYPTIADVEDYFRRTCEDRLDKLTLADLNEANRALSISVETLMNRFPGIHYNFLCRNVVGFSNFPPYSAILRRPNSAEAGRRPENAILQGYRERYPLLNLLETALLFEERRIALNSRRVKDISETPIRKMVPGDDSALKKSLVTHIVTGPASTWNPPELTQSIKNSLLSTAIEKGYERSIRFLMKLGGECSRERLLDRFRNTLRRRDVPAVLAILQEEWVDATFRNNVFVEACSTNFTELAAALLATKQVDVNALDRFNTTALIQACLTSNEELAELLMREPGIDVNKQNTHGLTALSYCGPEMSAVRARLLALGARDFEGERAAADRVKALCADKPAVSADLLTVREDDITDLNIYNRLNYKQVKKITDTMATEKGGLYISGVYTDNKTFIHVYANDLIACGAENVVASGGAEGGGKRKSRRARRKSRRTRRNTRRRFL